MADSTVPTHAAQSLLGAFELSCSGYLLLPCLRVHQRKLFFATLLPGRPWSNANPLGCVSSTVRSRAVNYVGGNRSDHQKDWTISTLGKRPNVCTQPTRDTFADQFSDLVWHVHDDSGIRALY